jgi:hypothetical protein
LPGVVVLGGDDSPPKLPDVAMAVRHPDMSVVIDLSHVSHPEKVKYLYTLLPLLAAIRRTTGLPHRIVVDEAHYFLHEPNIRELLDLNLGAYTFITYRLSDLHAEVRNAVEVLIVKRITDSQEIKSVVKMTRDGAGEAEWKSRLDNLTLDQAAILPGTTESEGQFRRFELFPRLTSHIRHKAKYLEMELIETQAFVFTAEDGSPVGTPARTLKEFCSCLKTCSARVLNAHAARSDFSRWIEGIFHDRVLASDIRKAEERSRLSHEFNLAGALVKAISDRYELSSTEPVTVTARSDADHIPELSLSVI